MRREFNWTALLQGLALLAISGICILLVFKEVPDKNAQLVSFCLGAIAGLLTGAGLTKVGAALDRPSTFPAAAATPPAEGEQS